MTIRVAIAGASGKLGRAAAELLDATGGFEVVARTTSRSDLSELLGPADAPSDVILDTTLPAVTQSVVEYGVQHDRNVVVGTSGWTAQRIASLGPLLAAHPERGVVIVPNFSLGSVLGTLFSAYASRYFDAVEIVETHGPGKIDSPSGTAVRTAELIQTTRGALGPVASPHADQRARGQQVATVQVHSLRLPGVMARQEVILGGTGETLSIVHDTVGTEAYSTGILRALEFGATATGVTVGLDRVLGIDLPHR